MQGYFARKLKPFLVKLVSSSSKKNKSTLKIFQLAVKKPLQLKIVRT